MLQFIQQIADFFTTLVSRIVEIFEYLAFLLKTLGQGAVFIIRCLDAIPNPAAEIFIVGIGISIIVTILNLGE